MNVEKLFRLEAAHNRKRAETAGVTFLATVRDHIAILETLAREQPGFDLSEENAGLAVLLPDLRIFKAPRTWDAWGLIGFGIGDDYRENPIVVTPPSFDYFPRELSDAVMPPVRCPACRTFHSMHDGIILRCLHCSYTRKKL